MKNIVVIGGKKGIFNVLNGLKNYPMGITAIVSSFDSGGSSGMLREKFGTLPFGDIRGALMALTPKNGNRKLRDLFDFRFKGVLAGHSFGNLYLQILTFVLGNEIKAIKKASKILGVQDKVLPISIDHAHLHALLLNGKIIKSETNIDNPKHNGAIKIKKIFLRPKARIYKESYEAILKADFIILGPGDLYTSILPNILVSGFNKALAKTKAKIIYIPNLMTKWGETNDFHASDFARVLLKYLKKDKLAHKLDWVICNSKPFKNSLIKKYKKEKAFPVIIDSDKLKKYSKNIVWKDIVSQKNIIKHDAKKLAKTIFNIIK